MLSKIRRYQLLLLGILILLTLGTRLFGLTISPPSLYWEEVALGYDAYSLLKTGKDHHGHPFPIVAFESFGDWKPAGYFYALLPWIAVFGLEDWVVRIPAALSGIVLVFAIAAVGKKVGLPYLLSFAVAAFSPWAIHFSRAGWEVMLATALLTSGMLFLWPTQKALTLRAALLGSVLCALAAYTYHATRLLSPVLLLLVFLVRYIHFFSISSDWRRKFSVTWNREYKVIFIAITSFFILYLPIVGAVFFNPELQKRYAETGNLFDIQLIEQSNALREREGNSLLARIIYHRYVLWAVSFFENITTHFSIHYLAVQGDENLRHGTKYFGIIYPIDVLFLAIGGIVYIRRRNRSDLLLLMWLLATVSIAALARPVPHALRTLPAIAPLLLLIGSGIYASYEYLRALCSKHIYVVRLVLFTTVIVYVLQFVAFWKYSLFVYPTESVGDWRYGYKQAVAALATAEAKYPELEIYVSREWGRPAMYYWFFTKTDPREVQAIASVVPKDQGEFLAFKKMLFVRSTNEVPERSILLLASEEQTSRYTQRATAAGLTATTIETIHDLKDVVVWKVTLIQ